MPRYVVQKSLYDGGLGNGSLKTNPGPYRPRRSQSDIPSTEAELNPI